MAIDTAARRRSCLGIALVCFGLSVLPDGSDLETAAQRQAVTGSYSGIPAVAYSTSDLTSAVDAHLDVYTMTTDATATLLALITAAWAAGTNPADLNTELRRYLA